MGRAWWTRCEVPAMSAAQFIAALLQVAIRSYQLAISPLFPKACRFEPSCSQYALEALEAHGPAHGSWLALCRVARCHPFNPGGLDLVPRGDRRGP